MEIVYSSLKQFQICIILFTKHCHTLHSEFHRTEVQEQERLYFFALIKFSSILRTFADSKTMSHYYILTSLLQNVPMSPLWQRLINF